MNHQETLRSIGIDFPEYKSLNPASCRSAAIESRYPEFFAWLGRTFGGVPFAERMYMFYHDIAARPVCPICGKPVPFMSMGRGYREFCSGGCRNVSTAVKERRERTSIRNHGTANPMQSAEVRKKMKRTCMERYGTDNVFRSDEVKDKSRKTCLERYGNEYACRTEGIKRKISESRRAHILCNNADIMDIIPGESVDTYIMKCPDPECTMCTDRQFRIASNVLYDRVRLGTDTCTVRYPVGVHIKNTGLERFVSDILDEHNIAYETNNRTILSGKELDIFIPSRRIAIECNGIYWHSLHDSEYHYSKWKVCRDKGIQLLSIWEDWIMSKPDIVRGIILSKLGIYDRRIMARQCSVGTVSPEEARMFLDANHIQGHCNSHTRLGLYYKDVLVSIMTFSKAGNAIMHHRNKDEEGAWVLSRFCTILGTQVVGGANRLLHHFLKNNPATIISFASHDISNGHLYEVLGFKETSETHSSYWYIHGRTHRRFHRSSFTKGVLVGKGYDPGLTEERIMMNTDYLRIYDSGQTKYELSAPSTTDL